MADKYITRIRTESGDLQIDYNALANLPEEVTLDSLGAVPNTRTINKKALTGNITLTAKDVGVNIDNTLSQEGHCADAKAVGDALAGKSDNGHTHSPDTIGAASENHTHEPDEIGAASVNTVTGISSALNDHIVDFNTHVSETNESIANIKAVTDAITPVVKMEKGGTGANNGADGLKNLFAAGYTVLSSHQYADDLPTDPAIPEGTLFFKKVSK